MQDPVPTRQDPEESPEPIDRLIHRALCLAGLVPAVAFGGWVAVGVFRALAYRSLRYGEEGYGDASSSEILWDVVSFLLSVILVPLLVVGVPLFFWKLLRLGPQGRAGSGATRPLRLAVQSHLPHSLPRNHRRKESWIWESELR